MGRQKIREFVNNMAIHFTHKLLNLSLKTLLKYIYITYV